MALSDRRFFNQDDIIVNAHGSPEARRRPCMYTSVRSAQASIVTSLKAYGTVRCLVEIKNMELQLQTFVRMLLR